MPSEPDVGAHSANPRESTREVWGRQASSLRFAVTNLVLGLVLAVRGLATLFFDTDGLDEEGLRREHYSLRAQPDAVGIFSFPQSRGRLLWHLPYYLVTVSFFLDSATSIGREGRLVTASLRDTGLRRVLNGVKNFVWLTLEPECGCKDSWRFNTRREPGGQNNPDPP